MRKHTLLTALPVSLVALVASLAAAPAMAADTAQAAPDEDAGAITVTARKRSEDILKVPVTVSAMTAAQLEARGVRTITDAVAASPGININNNSSGHADRSFQQISLRGFTPVTTLATTTSMFIDGVPVSSPSQLTAITDPDHIEILKGPQSAYFGRNTFAGAVNVVNKAPTGAWGAEAEAMIGNHANRAFKGTIEGSILRDLLTFRLTGSYMTKDGSWRNSDGSTLGDQSSRNGTLLVVAKPTDKLTIKLFGMLGVDDDGASAQTRLLANNIYGANADGTLGSVIYKSQANCTVNGNPWLCGTLPAMANGVSSNTTISSAMRSQLNSLRTMLNPNDEVQHYGLLRHTQHAHAVIDYTFSPHISLEILGGYNHETWSNLIDLDGFNSTQEAALNYSTGAYYTGNWDYPYVVDMKNRDWSTEGRLSYNFGSLHGVVGVSYLEAQSQQALGGPGTTGPSYGLGTSANGYGGVSKTKTFGAFFGITYDVTPKLSASFEGRYQIDTIAAYNSPQSTVIASSDYLPAGTYAPNALLGQQSFNNFAPRLIVNYQVNPGLMVYASWAKGVNPSTFNSSIITYAANIQATAKAAGIPLYARPEKVTNWELGVKGKTHDGALRYTGALYYAQWTDQVNSLTFAVPLDNGTVGLYSGYANTGAVDLWGLEGDVSWKVNRLITIDAAAAYNASRIIRYVNNQYTTLYGISSFYGKEMPNMSKYSANVGVTFGGDVRGMTDAKWFLRGDWNFKSGMWVDQANITRTPDLHLFNARLGMSKGKISGSLFMNNIFNNHTYVSAADNWTIEPTYSHFGSYSAVQVGLPDLRTFGVQLKVKM
ncbi:MAG TPA: TonB-dependent receptor [Novosphingobium sp.]|nr:TonB-dependent receptor [Novosphingobium sp.]